MKKYICDICGKEMDEERYMMIPMCRFDDGESFNFKCKDNCGYRDADICKYCEDKLIKSICSTITDIRAGKDGKECEYINEYGECSCTWSGCKTCMGPESCAGFSRAERFRNYSEETKTELYFDDTKEETEGGIK